MMRLIITSIAFIILTGCASYTDTKEEYYYASYPTNYPTSYPVYYPSMNTIYKTPMYYDTYFGGPLYPGPFQYGNYGYSQYDMYHYYYSKHYYRYH
ncbi:MAG TPA: hypothetical protein VHM20_07045 [Gammaproteobacteria bacterium]|jgi:hypothetical protein|nr:hypothetical protein [Gammaproteobacteria bacterium]